MNSGAEQRAMTVMAIALTFGSGVADVASFTRLGGVFTSVMTGNIVLWGLAAARGSLTLASHTAVSIAGYIAGVAWGTWIGHFGAVSDGSGSDGSGSDGSGPAGSGEGRASGLRSGARWTLLAELIFLTGL